MPVVVLRLNSLKITVHIIVVFILISGTGCENDDSVRIPKDAYEKLSQYNFFIGDAHELIPNNRVLPYDLNSPLFSDYAHKSRFVWMPDNQDAEYNNDDVFQFPKNTVLIKNFFFFNDERDQTKGRRIIETRLLIKRYGQWESLSYIWNDSQTDAFLEIVGDIKEVKWIDKKGASQKINYMIPNKNQCKNCHLNDKKLIPIGPKGRNLNKPYTYFDGQMNQLDKWTEVGYLTGYNADDAHSKVADWRDETSGSLNDRALAYLDINCGYCHYKGGSANTSGLHLVADASLDMSLGIYKTTVSAGAGTGGRQYSIVPGHPEQSIMVYRMNSKNPAVMMPELGRSIVHKEGVKLISDWIKKLEDPSEL